MDTCKNDLCKLGLAIKSTAINTNYVKTSNTQILYRIPAHPMKEFVRYMQKYVCDLIHGPGYLSRYSDSLQHGRLGDRLPVGARFSASVQTLPGAHPASYTMGTGTLPEVKWPGSGVDHPRNLLTKLKKE